METAGLETNTLTHGWKEYLKSSLTLKCAATHHHKGMKPLKKHTSVWACVYENLAGCVCEDVGGWGVWEYHLQSLEDWMGVDKGYIIYEYEDKTVERNRILQLAWMEFGGDHLDPLLGPFTLAACKSPP